jgi:hypothetical protein
LESKKPSECVQAICAAAARAAHRAASNVAADRTYAPYGHNAAGRAMTADACRVQSALLGMLRQAGWLFAHILHATADTLRVAPATAGRAAAGRLESAQQAATERAQDAAHATKENLAGMVGAGKDAAAKAMEAGSDAATGAAHTAGDTVQEGAQHAQGLLGAARGKLAGVLGTSRDAASDAGNAMSDAAARAADATTGAAHHASEGASRMAHTAHAKSAGLKDEFGVPVMEDTRDAVGKLQDAAAEAYRQACGAVGTAADKARSASNGRADSEL